MPAHRLLAALLLLALGALPSLSFSQPNYGVFSTPGYTPPQGSGNRAQGERDGTTQGIGNNRSPVTNDRDGQRERGARDERSLDDEQDLRGNDRPMRRLPPPPPSEFQKFVEQATGRMLQPFGTRFFSSAGDAGLSPDSVPVSADYVVGPGDEVLLRAWGSIDVDYRTRVDRNGQLNLPKVGSFNVSGVRASELEAHLRAQLSRLFTNFSLSVSLGQLRAVKVFVVGPAQRPGVYTLPSQSTLLSAVVAAGGPATNGSMRKLSLRRDGKIVSDIDVYEFLVTGDKSRDMQLRAGDVVVFHSVGPRVAVTGATDTPAIYELRGGTDESIRDVLRYAGGAPVLANPNRAQLERIDPGQQRAARFVETFRMDAAGLQKPMRDGDVLTLLAISPEFANAVTLKGHVAQPLRYPYKQGMRVRDLIPDRDALITPDFYRRKNLLVQMIEDDDDRDGRLADRDARGDRAGGASGAMVAPGRRADVGGPRVQSNRSADELQDRGDLRNGERAGTERQGSGRQVDYEISQRAKKSPAALFDELNWDYAVVERLNERDLTTQVIPFNLGRAILQGDPASNIELLPGDVVTVYSQKDIRVPVGRQTRLVSVEGEVVAPGIYQLQPGETLKQLLRRAGGLTPQAYLYGLDFSREETRLRQRENLVAAISRLQAMQSTQAARDAANRADPNNSAVSAAATQAQLARLRQVEPNGRIALELTPQSENIDALPDLPLDHADRLIVPARPGFITVSGAVVNSNAFLWKPGRTAGDYVKLAGLDEAAEPRSMFILRADGTVTHANDAKGLFGYGGLNSQPLYPGDAVVVPNQLDFETWGRAFVRNLKDWSQIISQFGLGAVAIQTLRNSN